MASSSPPLSSSLSSSTIPVDDFRCPITLELPIDPVETPCGHLFERSALVRVLNDRPLCPVCRSASPVSLIRHSTFVRRVLKPFISVDMVVETLDAFTPSAPIATPPAVDPVIARTPPMWNVRPMLYRGINFADHADRVALAVNDMLGPLPTVTVPDLLFDYMEDDGAVPPLEAVSLPLTGTNYVRTVQLTNVSLFNGSAINYSLLINTVRDHNVRFLVRRVLGGVSVDIFRYIFRSRGTLSEAVLAAANHGYYIYDMYNFSPNRFVIYTLQTRSDGSRHSLDPFV
jgi:hypothetical protein